MNKPEEEKSQIAAIYSNVLIMEIKGNTTANTEISTKTNMKHQTQYQPEENQKQKTINRLYQKIRNKPLGHILQKTMSKYSIIGKNQYEEHHGLT